MLRRLYGFLVAVFLAVPAVAQMCDLSMEVSCVPGQGGSVCTSTTTNNGAGCQGAIWNLWLASDDSESVMFGKPEASLHLSCFGSDEWAPGVAVCWTENGFIGAGTKFVSTVTVTGAETIPLMAMTWVGDIDTGEEYGLAYAFTNAEAETCTPIVSAPPVVRSGVEYTVSWTPVSDPTAQYIVEEAGSPDFSGNVTTRQLAGLSTTFLHSNMATTTTYYYRVRPTNCAGGTPTQSQVTQTVVQAETVVSPRNAEIAVPVGSTDEVLFDIKVPPPAGISAASTLTYTASMDKPFLGVNPKNGVVPAEGLTLKITARPASLPVGASTGTLTVAFTEQTATGVVTNAGAPMSIPVSISLVTPVAPGKKTLPPANAVIIPVVTHVNGASAPFLSDVRLTNAGGAATDYQVTMTSTRAGVTTSKVTQVKAGDQSTIALNDVVKNFFGFGATPDPNDVGFGALEIRPINTSSSMTFASSRTYATTVRGTYGQFIAAVPFARFATQRTGLPIPGVPVETPSNILSFQHVSQTSRFRTNLGLTEGAGEPADVRVRFFDRLGQLLKEVPLNLAPGQMSQYNIAFPPFEMNNFDNGRIEVVVDSATGAVTGYASVVDAKTSDPLAVMPVSPDKVSATRFVVPGVAELPPPAVQNFHSDVRLFNGGASAVTVTPTYYPQGGGAPTAANPISIAAGETLVLDNILPTLFGLSGTGGSVIFTTPEPASLVATGRTYTSVENDGSFGQFIPGVTPEEGIGLGERPLQLLQLEQSARFRSNIGLAELTGNPVTVRLTMHFPDTKTTATTNVNLGANQFFQFQPLPSPTYNGRITVEVLEGNGRVTAYGSVIDNESKDPTYVPAQ